MAANYTTYNGQNMFDVIVQGFGTLDSLSDFLKDNTSTDFNQDLTSKQELNVNSVNLGDEDVKREYVKRGYITNNQDEAFSFETNQKLFQNNDEVLFMNGDNFNFQ